MALTELKNNLEDHLLTEAHDLQDSSFGLTDLTMIASHLRSFQLKQDAEFFL